MRLLLIQSEVNERAARNDSKFNSLLTMFRNIILDITLENIKGNNGAADYTPWLKKLQGYLLNTLPNRCTNMRVTKMAVIFQYENEIEVDLLISPHIANPSVLYHFMVPIPSDYHSRQVYCMLPFELNLFSPI